MKTTIALTILFTSLASAAQAPVHFDVKDAREEVPHFKHHYTTATELRGHVALVMEAETETRYHCTPNYEHCEDGPIREYVVNLMQSDGKDLYFDPHAIPERLIDRDLVPWVQAACREALRIDREFMRGNPSEFIAQDGWHWTRKPKAKQ